MRYLNPRCYEYFRHKFNDNLPHSSTIRRWFSLGARSEHGFMNSAFKTLTQLATEYKAKDQTIYVALAFDEMSIRQHVQWLHHKKQFSGFVNFGTANEDQPLPIATDAIVIMLNGINLKSIYIKLK